MIYDYHAPLIIRAMEMIVLKTEFKLTEDIEG